MSAFNTWLDTYLAEKQIDLEGEFEHEGPSGTNFFSYGVVVEHIKTAPDHEQAAIKNMIVKIDFNNGDTCHFFRHLAQALVR